MICKNTKEKNAKIKQMKKKINKQKTNKKHKDYKLEALQIKVNRQTCDVWSCKLKQISYPMNMESLLMNVNVFSNVFDLQIIGKYFTKSSI